MLDERVITLAQKSASTQLRDLDRRLALSAAANRAAMHGNSRLYIQLMQLYVQDVARRAQIIWQNLHRAHSSFGATLSPNLAGDLVAALRTELDAMLASLRPKFDDHMSGAPKSAKRPSWTAQLEEACNHELARYEAEVEHYVASLNAAIARGTPPAPSYVIHGTVNVGAVVTGAGAVTNVIQNVGSDQRQALHKALELVRQALAAAPELSERDRSELGEVADDAEREIAKEEPNARRLGFALQSLASTVQGIASGPSAYEVLRAAAAAIGMSV